MELPFQDDRLLCTSRPTYQLTATQLRTDTAVRQYLDAADSNSRSDVAKRIHINRMWYGIASVLVQTTVDEVRPL